MLLSIQVLFSFFFVFTFVVATPSPRGRYYAKGSGSGVPVSNANALNIISGKYIVVYNSNVTDSDIEAHQSYVKTALKKRSIHTRSNDGSRVLSSSLNTFSMMGWRGMSLEAEDAMILEIASSPMVNFVEADVKVQSHDLLIQTGAPTGLKRLSHASISTTGYVFDNTAGSGVVAYVVDTGIRITHSEFEGRATWGKNFVNTNNTDENGHGSHVSGTIGGVTYGVAKNISLVAVKVLNAAGAGTNSGVIQGLNFVSTNVTARGLSGKAVVNISIGGSFSQALNSAVAGLTRAGITVVCAAGNDNADASNTSPASATTAITVGAIDATTDTRASFSNFGGAVDIFAPGVSVLSVGITNDTASAILSRTSMASPHVTGLAAYLISLEKLIAPADVKARIQSLAVSTGSVVLKPGANTTTLIAYNGDGH